MRAIGKIIPLAAIAAITSASALEVRNQGAVSWACGGAGEQERIELKEFEAKSNAALLFVTEVRGGYLADVDFVVRNQSGTTVVQARADGPMCFLSLPAGSYRVEASYQGSRRSASLQVAASIGKPSRTTLTFPRDPSEKIAPSAEEKAGVVVK